MDEVLELWPADARADLQAPTPRKRHNDRALFLWKAGLLLATTIALVPILAWQHELAATAYVAFLVVVHVLGLAVFAWGVTRQHIAPSRRGLAVRIGGLVALTGLLYLASKGLGEGFGTTIFWVSLTSIWLLHTAGAALLHLRPRVGGGGEPAGLCPFV